MTSPVIRANLYRGLGAQQSLQVHNFGPVVRANLYRPLRGLGAQSEIPPGMCPAPDAIDCGVGVPNPLYYGPNAVYTTTTIPATASWQNYLPWIAAGVLVIFLMGRRR